MITEIQNHLLGHILPFWNKMRDNTHGGFYGEMDIELNINRQADKGCILNSRILWFYSNVYMEFAEAEILEYATHAYECMIQHFWDDEQGGVYWSIHADGSVSDDSKHTYCQAFALYALASYYGITHDETVLVYAMRLFELMESKCVDEIGYLEALDRNFQELENDKLSENGVSADRTMNTILHIFEAYTELYRVNKDERVAEKMHAILEIFKTKVFNEEMKRQEVFFDKNYNSLIDLHSYGHDIETAWLLDRGLSILGDDELSVSFKDIMQTLERKVYEIAYNGSYIYNECCDGIVNKEAIWWVQAEAMVGFYNAYTKNKEKKHYITLVENIWAFIQDYIVDSREGSEWLWEANRCNQVNQEKGIVNAWKCPYHNGRMCLELIRRARNDTQQIL